MMPVRFALKLGGECQGGLELPIRQRRQKVALLQ
jgi:hypothetical protein